jgi:hypothetical protein
MPWLETDVRDQRLQFVLAVRQQRGTVSALCRAFGVSRQTGYKWLRREAAAHSVAVLSDRSRRPHRSPTRTEDGTTADGLTALSVFLLKQGIQLLYGAVRHPQTQGKVERFHRTLAERLRWRGVPTTLPQFVRTFRWFRDEYNEIRPHAALAMEPPAARFTPSRRAYRATPRAWEYPAGAETRRVQPCGIIHWGGTWHFVSQALRGERVACAVIGDRVLVIYRHMYVRELHPRSRRSVPLLEPVVGTWPVEAVPPPAYDRSAMS